MGNYTREEILQMAEEEDVEFIRLQDLDTFAILPWRPQQGKVARLLCDIYCPDGTPHERSPRYILKKTAREAKKEGYTCLVDPECEFFLFHTDDNGVPTTVTHEKAGYLDVSPVDRIMSFKMTVRTIAKRHGLHATFMPKPRAEVNGSGMHIHFSLFKDGRNVFVNPGNPQELSEEAYYFVGGLLAHSKEMALITNPIVNSYKRLVPGYEAPTELTWTKNNQNSLVRIPGSRGMETRIELRSPDAAANPYLVFAVCLAAGLDGINKKIYPTKSSSRELSETDQKTMKIENLPGNLNEAIDYFEQSDWIKEVLGTEFCKEYAAAKKKEWLRYTREISAWEIEEYLYRI